MPKPEDRLSSGTMCHLWEYVHCEQSDDPDPEKTPPHDVSGEDEDVNRCWNVNESGMVYALTARTAPGITSLFHVLPLQHNLFRLLPLPQRGLRVAGPAAVATSRGTTSVSRQVDW